LLPLLPGLFSIAGFVYVYIITAVCGIPDWEDMSDHRISLVILLSGIFLLLLLVYWGFASISRLSLAYLVNLRRAILKLFLLLSHSIGYASGLINKYYNNDRLNYAGGGVGILLLIIYVISILVIVLINMASLNYDVITTYSYIASLWILGRYCIGIENGMRHVFWGLSMVRG
jgi:hypothetical protein